MKTSLRLFIAVPVPDAVTRFLKDIRYRLTASDIKMRWVPVKNIHLTLQFLGDVDKGTVTAITEQMDLAVAAAAPISLTASGVGGFPSLRRFRILWVGLDGDTRQLADIQGTLASRLEAIGFARERRFYHPHLTVGRARYPLDGRRLGERISELADSASDPFMVDRICLFASLLRPGGAEYTCLHTAHLAG